MSKVGRRPNAIPSIEWKCHIPVDIAAQVDLVLLDPVTNKPKHGSRSALVAGLLRDWLAKQIKQQPEKAPA